MDTTTLQAELAVNAHVLERNIAEIDHEASVRQPAPGGNCANWVLGHIVRTRNKFLPVMGKASPYPAEKFDGYEVDPITDASQAIAWDELVRMYRETTAPITEGIGSMTPADLAKPAPFSPGGNPDETIGSLLMTFTFHEIYHAGQLGVLRRLVGKEGAIKSPEAKATK